MADQESLLRQVGVIENRLDEEVARIKRGQMTTIIIGIVLIVVIGAYFTWASTTIRGLLAPEDIAAMAGDQARTYITESRPELERMATEQAPLLVNNLADDLIENRIPQGREFIEETVRENAQIQVNKVVEFVLDSFETVVEEQGETMREIGEALETEAGRLEFKDMMKAQMEEALEAEEIIISLDSYGTALEELEALMTRLATADPGELSDYERVARELIVLVRELAGRSELQLGDLPTFQGIDEAVE